MNGNFRLFALATIVDRYLECDRYEFLLNWTLFRNKYWMEDEELGIVLFLLYRELSIVCIVVGWMEGREYFEWNSASFSKFKE